MVHARSEYSCGCSGWPLPYQLEGVIWLLQEHATIVDIPTTVDTVVERGSVRTWNIGIAPKAKGSSPERNGKLVHERAIVVPVRDRVKREDVQRVSRCGHKGRINDVVGVTNDAHVSSKFAPNAHHSSPSFNTAVAGHQQRECHGHDHSDQHPRVLQGSTLRLQALKNHRSVLVSTSLLSFSSGAAVTAIRNSTFLSITR